MRKIESKRSSKYGFAGNPEVAVIAVDRWLALILKGEEPPSFCVDGLNRGYYCNLFHTPLSFFDQRDLAEAHIREASEIFHVCLSDFFTEELVKCHEDLVPFKRKR